MKGGEMSGPSRRVPVPQNKGASVTTKKHMKKHIDRYLQEVAFDAAQHIYNTMTDKNMPPDLRLRAAFDIMDRTTGKSAGKVEQRVIDDVEDQRSMPDISNVPTNELEQILEQLEKYQQPAQIEGTAVRDEEFDLDG